MKVLIYRLLLAGGLCCGGAIIAIKFLERSYEPFPYVDFDLSMQTAKYPDKLTEAWGKPVIQTLKLLYTKNNVRNVPYEARCKIPRIIHQVWLGSPFPEKYKEWQKSWKTHHPEWEYRLWTDADIERLVSLGDFFVGDTYRYYTQATNYGERSDILKILLIYYFG